MTKIVFNACGGGYGLSEAAIMRYAEIKGINIAIGGFSVYDIDRTDPALVQVVEELGEAVNDMYSELRIAEVPADTLYRIDEYDGRESVITQDDYDWSVA